MIESLLPARGTKAPFAARAKTYAPQIVATGCCEIEEGVCERS
jgi:hypothetical protein